LIVPASAPVEIHSARQQPGVAINVTECEPTSSPDNIMSKAPLKVCTQIDWCTTATKWADDWIACRGISCCRGRSASGSPAYWVRMVVGKRAYADVDSKVAGLKVGRHRGMVLLRRRPAIAEDVLKKLVPVRRMEVLESRVDFLIVNCLELPHNFPEATSMLLRYRSRTVENRVVWAHRDRLGDCRHYLVRVIGAAHRVI